MNETEPKTEKQLVEQQRQEGAAAEAPKKTRPGCITYLALALVLGGCMNVGNGSTLSEVPDSMLAGLGNFTILMGLVAFVVAYGIWKLRLWAFYLYFALVALNILAGFMTASRVSALIGPSGATQVVAQAIGQAVGGVIFMAIVYRYRNAFDGTDGEIALANTEGSQADSG